MQTKSVTKTMGLAVRAVALSSALFMVGCVDGLSVSAVAEPAVIVMGEGAVSLIGEVSADAATADFEWRLVKGADGSELEFPTVQTASASFTPDVPGEYEFLFSATGGNTRSGGGLASGVGARSIAAARVKVSVLKRPVGVLRFVTQPSDVAAGSAFEPNVRVDLRNEDGEIVNEAVGVTVSLVGGATAAQVLGTETVTTVNGVATFTDLSVDLVGTGYTFEASAEGMTSAQSKAFAVSAGAADASTTTFVAKPRLLLADGAATSTLLLSLKDAYGNAVAGENVAVEVTGDGNTLVGQSGQTDVKGQFTSTLTSDVLGTKTATATFGANGDSVSTDVAFVQQMPSAQNSQFYVPDGIVADGEDEAQLSVLLMGPQGAPAPGVPVTFSSEEPADIFSEQTVTTDEAGEARVTLTSTKSGLRELKASFGDESLTENVRFFAGAPDPEKSSFTANPTKLPADGESEATLTLVLVDKHGNPVSDVWPAINATYAGEGPYYDSEVVTDEDGIAIIRVRSSEVGTVKMFASVSKDGGAAAVEFSVELEFTLAPPAIYGIYADSMASACTWIGVEAGQAQGHPFNIRFEYRDIDGVLQPATSTDGSGNESDGGGFDWDAETDLKDWVADVVVVVVTPYFEEGGDVYEGASVSQEIRLAKLFYSAVTWSEPGVVSVAAMQDRERRLTDLVASAAKPPALFGFRGAEGFEPLGKMEKPMLLKDTPSLIELGDVNNDGSLDFILGYPDDGRVDVVIENGGDEDPVPTEYSEISPAAMFLWDVTGSGELDLVVAGTRGSGTGVTNVVAVLENSQMGFSEKYTIIEGDMPERLTGLTVGTPPDAGGLVEIVATDAAGDVHVFILKPGTSDYRHETFRSGLQDAHSPTLVTNPNFGLFDIIVASTKDRAVSRLTSLWSDGYAGYEDATLLAKDLADAPVSLVADDFIGYEDLLVVLSSGVVHLLENRSGTFVLRESVAQVAPGSSSVTVGNFNGDRYLDFAVANPKDGTISVVYGGEESMSCEQLEK